MCGRADDHFGPPAWGTLGELFGPLGWESDFSREEVRPTDQLRFVRRAAGGFDAPHGRWGWCLRACRWTRPNGTG